MKIINRIADTATAITSPMSSHLGFLFVGFNPAAGINKDEPVCTTSFCCGGYSESFLGAEIGRLALDAFYLFNNNMKRCVCLGYNCSVVFPLNFKAVSEKLIEVKQIRKSEGSVLLQRGSFSSVAALLRKAVILTGQVIIIVIRN